MVRVPVRSLTHPVAPPRRGSVLVFTEAFCALHHIWSDKQRLTGSAEKKTHDAKHPNVATNFPLLGGANGVGSILGKNQRK